VTRSEGSSRWAAASWPWMARRIGACVLALLAACGSLSGMTTTHASSDGTIFLSPPTAAAGTQVSANIHIFATPVQDFVLKATTTAPEQGGCASAVPIPGVPAYPMGGPAGGVLGFPWPASLGTNLYWLCALPTAGGPAQAWSAPYIVTQDAAPALRVTPGLVLPGSTLQVAISDWLAPDHGAPTHLWIVRPDGLTRSDVPFQVLTPPDVTGACTLSVTLPLTFPPGDAFLIAGSAAYYQRSGMITVQKPEIATALAIMNATATAPHAVGTAPSVLPQSDNVTLFFGLGAGVLLLLVMGGIVLLVARRRP
jgi:hypothetical protein